MYPSKGEGKWEETFPHPPVALCHLHITFELGCLAEHEFQPLKSITRVKVDPKIIAYKIALQNLTIKQVQYLLPKTNPCDTK